MIMNAQPHTLTSRRLPRSASPRVGIVIVNYRTADQTIACVRSLDSLRYPNRVVVVVDNDSQDGSDEQMEQSLPQAHIVRAEVNGGYTLGNNIGIEAALGVGCDYILVLNPDTVAINDDFVTSLVDFAESHPRVAAVGPRVYLRSHGVVQNTVLEFPWLTRRVAGVAKRWLGRTRPLRSGNTPCKAEVLNGVCVLFRAEALFDVGLFDPKTFAYIEDVDWAYRARRQQWALWYLPVDSIIHEQKQAGYHRGSTVDLLLKRNTLYFLLKTRRYAQAAAYTVSTTAMGIAGLCTGRLGDRRFLRRLLQSYAGLWTGRADRVMGRPVFET